MRALGKAVVVTSENSDGPPDKAAMEIIDKVEQNGEAVEDTSKRSSIQC